MNSDYHQKLCNMANIIDRIHQKTGYITEGIANSEWKYLSKIDKGQVSKKDVESLNNYIESVKEIHYHVEAILTYVNNMSEHEGIPLKNGC